jgi:hypothetical protein
MKNAIVSIWNRNILEYKTNRIFLGFIVLVDYAIANFQIL